MAKGSSKRFWLSQDAGSFLKLVGVVEVDAEYWQCFNGWEKVGEIYQNPDMT